MSKEWQSKFNEEWKKQVDLALENSEHHIGKVMYNSKTKHIGPVQRLVYSNNKVIYYHGNNPCQAEDLVVPVKRRQLNG